MVDAIGPVGSAPQGVTLTSTSTANDMLHQVVAVASVYYQRLPGGSLVNYHYWACYKQGISRGIFFRYLRC
jgi:hypothetical protein